MKLAGPLLARLASLDLELSNLHARSRHLMGGLLSSILTDDELVRLSGRLYANVGLPRGLPERFEWEERWLHELLPPAPARILVGGAGYGRECLWLRERGYEVDAYDPNADGIAHLRARLPAEAVCLRASHEDLADAVLDGVANECRALVSRSPGAVLLGWGSLSHVLTPRWRARVLEACAALTEGPILASARVSAESRQAPRMQRVGEWLGKRLGGREPPPQLQYQPQHGFAATLSAAELEAAADALGRELRMDEGAGVSAIALLR
jgi:hypothetical protein